MADLWDDEDRYWRENYSSRPYAKGSDVRRAHSRIPKRVRVGEEVPGRKWPDVERDLERDWSSYSYRGKSTWQQIRDAARDAWDRVTGRG